jgi:hypothetical protein
MDVPGGFDRNRFHQLRVMVRGGKAVAFLENVELGTFPFVIRGLSPGIFARSGTAAVEMVRAMAI